MMQNTRWHGGWLLLVWLVLLAASLYTLTGDWGGFVSLDSMHKMGQFIAGFYPPAHTAPFLQKLALATCETLAISWLGSLLAALWGLGLALPAAGLWGKSTRRGARLLLNILRSVPELVWAGLLVIAAGLGPLPGMLALAIHTTGVLGRLYADSIENTPAAAFAQLHALGTPAVSAWCYTTLPQIWPQLASYFLYRWENNIRAAAVLGVVGAGGLGQMLFLHLSLFQFNEAASVLLAMIGLVLLVDQASYLLRKQLA
ncbi:MAG: phosphonate transporter, permease protein PhnE [Pseudomonadota bacterium]